MWKVPTSRLYTCVLIIRARIVASYFAPCSAVCNLILHWVSFETGTWRSKTSQKFHKIPGRPLQYPVLLATGSGTLLHVSPICNWQLWDSGMPLMQTGTLPSIPSGFHVVDTLRQDEQQTVAVQLVISREAHKHRKRHAEVDAYISNSFYEGTVNDDKQKQLLQSLRVWFCYDHAGMHTLHLKHIYIIISCHLYKVIGELACIKNLRIGNLLSYVGRFGDSKKIDNGVITRYLTHYCGIVPISS